MNANLAFGKPSRKLTLANMGLENFSLSKIPGQERKEHTHEKSKSISILSFSSCFFALEVLLATSWLRLPGL